MTNPNPGTPLASNLFGPSRLTRPSTGYEPKPASEEEEARLVPFAQPSPQLPEPLGGVRQFNPDYLRSLLRQGPGGPMAPGGPSSSNMQIVPALPVGAPQVLNPRDGPEPEDRGFLVLMGRPAPSTPRNFPQPGSFIESSQAVIARWNYAYHQTAAADNSTTKRVATGVATTTRDRGATPAGLPKTSGTLAPRMREELHSYYENKWELVRQRAKEEFFRLEDASERQQVHMQQELNQRLMTAESQLERHQTELVHGFTERIQQGKNELQGARQAETRLRSELSQHQQRSERATITRNKGRRKKRPKFRAKTFFRVGIFPNNLLLRNLPSSSPFPIVPTICMLSTDSRVVRSVICTICGHPFV